MLDSGFEPTTLGLRSLWHDRWPTCLPQPFHELNPFIKAYIGWMAYNAVLTNILGTADGKQQQLEASIDILGKDRW